MTISFMHPAAIMIVGALLLPLFRGPFRKPYMILIPLLTFIDVLYLSGHPGTYGVLQFMDWELTFGRVDRLSMIFAFIMSLMAIIGTIYGMHVEDEYQHMASWFYVAGSLGAIYAADYITLFLFWEMMAFASTFLIWARKDKEALEAGYRYILVHTFGGVILLLGFVLRYQATGDLSFDLLDVKHPELYTWLIMIGLMLNAAVPPLHSWLPDAYSKATAIGAVFMCAFTTKTAVYTLIRSCAGFDVLIYLGIIMAIYGIIYAIMENDVRKLLGWEIISQVGYMVTAVGIGTTLALNGASAHAFAHILYKGLLFMGAGAILTMTGKQKLTDLGGLYKSMPVTCLFCIVGAASISAFPLFSGFVSKSLVMSAAAHEHLWTVWFILLFAAAGVFHHAGIKIPFFTFYGHDAGHRVKEAPMNMLIAMGIAAFLCVFIGTFPQFLYDLLPYQVDYEPYTYGHVLGQLQLLFFSAMAFTLLLLSGIYPAEIRAINLDFDWLYRKGGALAYLMLDKSLNGINSWANRTFAEDGMGTLANYFKDGPARLLLLVIKPFWRLTGVKISGPDGMENRFLNKFRSTFFSIGSAAIFSLGLLLLFFLVG